MGEKWTMDSRVIIEQKSARKESFGFTFYWNIFIAFWNFRWITQQKIIDVGFCFTFHKVPPFHFIWVDISSSIITSFGATFHPLSISVQFSEQKFRVSRKNIFPYRFCLNAGIVEKSKYSATFGKLWKISPQNMTLASFHEKLRKKFRLDWISG